MSNVLGINFLRYINEESATGWCQVFARLPFDDVELLEKGALFGVVSSSDKEGWGDVEVELTNWMEGYFNVQEKKPSLLLFFDDFRKKFPDLKAGWSWVTKNNSREVRITATDGILVMVKRDEKIIDLSSNVQGRVIVGQVGDSDSYFLGSLEMGLDVDKWDEMVKDVSVAR